MTGQHRAEQRPGSTRPSSDRAAPGGGGGQDRPALQVKMASGDRAAQSRAVTGQHMAEQRPGSTRPSSDRRRAVTGQHRAAAVARTGSAPQVETAPMERRSANTTERSFTKRRCHISVCDGHTDNKQGNIAVTTSHCGVNTTSAIPNPTPTDTDNSDSQLCAGHATTGRSR